ncbi:MAG: 3-alpha,7-alpha,12-alpha-trihydroxy-5-beta-cholest-24-enoyl-CoA hydratase [Myxococcales bacterium]|nr:3-alpha,7-alpha,12-alpha-trihydroxy-5-beta-cholest-24-enoyl-CoA hydratase [Myxococcales bacterium]
MRTDLIGTELPPLTYTYTNRDALLYALSVGCGPDDLDFVYEGRGPKVLPTFAVVPPFELLFSAVRTLEMSLTRVVHGEQDIEIHRPIPAEATVETRATVSAIQDKGKHAVCIITAKTYEQDTELFTTTWSILYRGGGGFGGDPGPKQELPEIADDQRADFVYEQVTRADQALIYRLNGDRNPLHVDPAFAEKAGFPKPILHGLCSYGIAGRAVLSHLGNDLSRFAGYWARFTAPVFPGEVLTTEGFVQDNGQILTRTSNGSDQVVLIGLARLQDN